MSPKAPVAVFSRFNVISTFTGQGNYYYVNENRDLVRTDNVALASSDNFTQPLVLTGVESLELIASTGIQDLPLVNKDNCIVYNSIWKQK